MMIPKTIKPETVEDVERWDAQSKAYRVLRNEHLEDAREEIWNVFAPEIAAQATVNPDMSRNPLRQITADLNVLYDEDPAVTIDTEADLSRILTPTLWPLSQQRQACVLAVGECLTRLDWDADRMRVKYRVVPPHTTVCWASQDDPSKVVRVQELRERIYKGKITWAWDEWDCTDPSTPFFSIKVYDEQAQVQDITEEVVGDAGYPYLDAEGNGILPYVLHHHYLQAGLWDWRDSLGMVNGTLRSIALWSHWCDGFVSAAHPQRIAIDLEPPAGAKSTVNGTPVTTVALDRTSVLMFRSTHSDRPGSISEWGPSLDMLAAVEALNSYIRDVAISAGISPADFQITSGQSGYAIVLSREGKRHTRRAQIPAARVGDQELLATAARMVGGIIDGYDAPTDSEEWAISYNDIDSDVVEKKGRIEIANAQLEAGLIAEPQALMIIHPDWDEEKALFEYLRTLEMKMRVEQARNALTANAPNKGTEDPEEGQGS